MKIRDGFVSNSSSSSFMCYEVVISPKFQLTREMTDWAINNTELDEYVGNEEECRNLLQRAIESLKNHAPVQGICDDYGSDPLFETIESLFAQFGGGKVVSCEESTEDNNMRPLNTREIDKRIAELDAARRVIVPSNNSRPPTS